jgi:hypothetical protein
VAVDGALFLDASINTYGGSVHDGGGSAFDNRSQSPGGGMDQDRETNDTPCKVLGLSEPSGDEAVARPEMSESFLKSLLEQYPRGKVWNLEESATSEHVLNASEKADLHSISDSQLRADRVRTKHAEAKQLQRLFPGVRSLGLVGSWDGGCNCTSYLAANTNFSVFRASHSRAMVLWLLDMDIFTFSGVFE